MAEVNEYQLAAQKAAKDLDRKMSLKELAEWFEENKGKAGYKHLAKQFIAYVGNGKAAKQEDSEDEEEAPKKKKKVKV